MTTKVSKKIAASLHAAVDEIIASNPEAATALEIIFSNVTQAKGAVAVSARKGAAASRKKPVVNEVEDDDDDAELLDDAEDDDDDADADDDDEADSLEDDEDEEEVKPKKGGRGRPAKKDADELDDDDDDNADEGDDDAEGDDEAAELPELETLDSEAIMNFMNEVGDAEPEIHERANISGVKELAAEIDRFGFDASGLMKGDLATKRANLKAFLSSIYYTVDAVMEFEVDGVIAAAQELDGSFVAKGKGRAKELAAAEGLVIAVVANS